MFIGEYQHSLDEKNRMSVPFRFRGKLTKGAVVTRGLDSCLFLYQKEEWQRIAQKIADLPFSSAKTRAFSRLMLAGAVEVKLDNQGRIILPDYLKKFAKIKRKLIIAGLYSRIEIWDSRVWQEYKEKTEKEAEKIAENMVELGIWLPN